MTTPVQFETLTPEENELLTKTDAGTPMGEYFRRFWLPALLSEELPEPGCPPIRVKLLGEELVAFRDAGGNVGLLDRYCPHRGNDMFFARNEGDGLRCISHGWKYDVNGECVDMPTEPPESPIKDKIPTKIYPVKEYGGCIWTYMGPPELQPELPELEWAVVPESNRYISKRLQVCNWAQALEIDIDSSHIGFLHAKVDGSQPQTDKSPRFRVKETPGGLLIAARRNTDDEDIYSWRVNIFLKPCYTFPPGSPKGHWPGHAWVPIDDENCWNYSVTWRLDQALSDEDNEELLKSGVSNYSEVAPGLYHLPGHYETLANLGNDYLIDREIQKTQTLTGLTNNGLQDSLAIEPMRGGAIVDRTREHLGMSDTGIVEFRKIVLKAIRDLKNGIEPEAAHSGKEYKYRSIVKMLNKEQDFFEVTKDEIKSTA